MRIVTLCASLALIAPTLPVMAIAQTASAASAANLGETPAAPVADLVALVDIPYETFTLDNGLRVIVHEDRKAPVVAISVWYNVGSKDEPQGRTGFAHLFEHLMYAGSENSPGSFFVPMRSIGATDMNGTTWFDRTNYFQTVPTPALEQALYIESDRMGYLLGEVSQERLDNQRSVVQNEKRQGDNQPYGLVQYAQLEGLFPEGHPYRHSTIGSMADLDAASLEDVRDWFRQNYGPNNAVLVLAGDIDAAEARRLTERFFGTIPRGPVNEPAQASVPTLEAPVSLAMTDRVANTRLYRSWAVPGMLDADAVPLAVAGSVLGGLASSRLDNELVRSDQSAVSVTASMMPFQRVGMFTVMVNVKPGVDAADVERRLDQIIADFIQNGPTADEVQRVATSQASQRIQGLEQVGGFGGKAVALAEGLLYADDPEFYRQTLTAYASVTPETVTSAMQRWLTRPVWGMRVEPGERAAYQEASAAPSGAAAPTTEAAPVERVAREAVPAIGEVSDLDFPDVERATLSNGIEVIYAHSDTVPMTRVAVEFDAGSAADAPGALGVHSLMLNLLTEGTTERDSNALAEARERLGASLFAGAGIDRSVVTLTAVSPNLAPSLDLLSEVIRQPAFAPSEVERLRAQRLSQIASELTQPAALGQRVLPVVLFGETHPYGRPTSATGTPESISAVTRDDLVAAHQTWIRPDTAKIFITSDRPLAELTALLEARFGAWTAPSVPRGVKAFDVPTPAIEPRIILIDRPQSPQSIIMAGVPLPVTGRDDLLVFNAANTVLGSDFLSRINTELREVKGWSYGVSGYLSPREHAAPYMLQAPVQADRTGESIAALIEQMNRFLTTNGVTAEELQRTIDGNTRGLAGSYETSGQVLGALRTNDLYDRPDNYWETVASRTRAMTAADLDAAARNLIDPSQLVWVVVGDASVVQPQLESLGLPVEVRPAN
jgi:zinc protease